MAALESRILVAELPKEARERLGRDLRVLFPDAQTHEVVQLSVGPPAWVEVAAELTTWTTVFKAAAMTYLSVLAKHLGDRTWEHREEIVQAVSSKAGNTISALRTFYSALRRADQSTSKQLGFRVTMPGPGVHKIGVLISVDSESEFIEQFARFIVSAEKIRDAAQRLQETENPPGYDVFCKCNLNGGFTLRWQREPDLAPFEQHYGSDGKPLTQSTRRHQTSH